MPQHFKQQFSENLWDINMEAYCRLCYFIKSLGITPRQLAKLLNASPTVIKKIEQGQLCLPIDWIIQFLTQSGIDPDWLITGTLPLTEKNPTAHADLLKHLEVPEIHDVILDELKKAKANLKFKLKKNARKQGKQECICPRARMELS